jgi:hypothetical protein
VAIWINTQHLWGLDQPGIPQCWPWHPHLVHDLAVVASVRYLAQTALTPTALEDWHRHTLPDFLTRIAVRLDEGCSTGHHTSRPREGRDRDHREQLAAESRSQRFEQDKRSEYLS